MATDVNVQYFSHLNGLTLANNWGDLIRLLDTCLVNGLPLPAITSAVITGAGDLQLTFFAAHNAMLFQIIELTGFDTLNGKYRIKGVPSTTQLILKAELIGQTITTTGNAKLASLGHEIVFRDVGDVKRVYRAIDPTVQHPFIRVDETISDGTNSYASTYAKFAMVGLLENMTHIDDYENPDVLQLPFDATDPEKNWKITGVDATVVRGWSKWYWATRRTNAYTFSETNDPVVGNRPFSLIGDRDAFYFMPTIGDLNWAVQNIAKVLYGVGIYNSVTGSAIPAWFLMTSLLPDDLRPANSWVTIQNLTGGAPLSIGDTPSKFLVCDYNVLNRVSNSIFATPILPNYSTGRTNIYDFSSPAALEIPFVDATRRQLRGSLKHIYFRGMQTTTIGLEQIVAEKSMYVRDTYEQDWSSGIYNAVNFYLGDLE